MKPGLYPDMPAEAYHADVLKQHGTRSLSSSGARKILATCPAQYVYDADNPPEPSDALRIGSAAHEWLLEGETWPQRHVVLPDDFNGRTKAGKGQLEAIEASGKRAVKFEEFEAIKAMVEALRAHPIGGTAFQHGRREVSGFWQDDETGVWRRVRWDYLPDRGRILVDYKTCQDAHPDAIARGVHTYGYHQQAAWYCEAAKVLDAVEDDPLFLIVFQQKTAPYLVTPVVLDGDALFWGRKLNRKAVDLFAACLERGQWPGYGSETQATTIGLPQYALRETERRDKDGALELAYWFQSPIKDEAA